MEDLPPGFLSLGRGPRAPAFAFPTPPPPPLLDEIVEEVLLRLPPADPALLLRAAAVCRRWAGIVTDAGFRSRYTARHHRAPPMLGYFASLVDSGGSARFFPTGDSFRPRIADRHGYRAHDARAGRVLLNRISTRASAAPLVVWDPVTDDRWDLPLLLRPQQVRSWNAAVLPCSRPGTGPGPGPAPFRVAFVGFDADEMFAHVYSSQPGAWGEVAATGELPNDPDEPGDRIDETIPGTHAGDAVYFALASGTGVVRFHLGARSLTIVPLPARPHPVRIVLRAMEGGGLGFAEVDPQSTLRIWAMDNAGQWVVSRAVELGTQLPAQVSSVYNVVASADAAGVLFLRTNHGLYTYDLESGDSIRVWSNRVNDLVPFEGFYTPVLPRALTVEGPSAGA